jgi:hypothetical protein
MKIKIISVLIVSAFLISTPFISHKTYANELSLRDFINLLVTIGVISPDKMPAVNTFLLTLETQNSSSNSAPKSIPEPTCSIKAQEVIDTEGVHTAKVMWSSKNAEHGSLSSNYSNASFVFITNIKSVGEGSKSNLPINVARETSFNIFFSGPSGTVNCSDTINKESPPNRGGMPTVSA